MTDAFAVAWRVEMMVDCWASDMDAPKAAWRGGEWDAGWVVSTADELVA